MSLGGGLPAFKLALPVLLRGRQTGGKGWPRSDAWTAFDGPLAGGFWVRQPPVRYPLQVARPFEDDHLALVWAADSGRDHRRDLRLPRPARSVRLQPRPWRGAPGRSTGEDAPQHDPADDGPVHETRTGRADSRPGRPTEALRCRVSAGRKTTIWEREETHRGSPPVRRASFVGSMSCLVVLYK